MIKGRSILLFLADGIPGGIITAEIMNWTGHVLVAPRSRLADLIQRSESGRTGIYVLTGTDPEGSFKPLIYVGETDNVGKRLAQHNKDDAKEFWEQTCVVTSKDQNLTKAHVRYLESRLITIATEAGRAKLVNGNEGTKGASLPEADLADMEFFIEQLRIMLPVLGLDFLKEPAKASPAPLVATMAGAVAAAEQPGFELVSKKYDLRAEAWEINGDFVVLAQSQAQSSWIGSVEHCYQNLHRQLIDNGVLIPEGTGHYRFLRDYAFSSPSAAAAVALGRISNGRKEWCVKGTKKTYADWQDEQIAAIPQAGGDE